MSGLVALTPGENYEVVGYLAALGTKKGLMLADLVNSKFGASARRRAGLDPAGPDNDAEVSL